MTNYETNELPSIIDTKFSILDEIEKSLSIKFAKNNKNLSVREKIIIDRKNKKLIPYKNLTKAIVFNQISAIYIVGKKFGAGIYKEELGSDLFIDDKGKFIKSAYYFSEHDITSEILKYQEPNSPKKKKSLELVVEHLEELAKLGNFPPIQKILDNSKSFILAKESEENTKKSEEDKRKIFDGLLNIELTRGLENWSSLREVAAREIIHSSFRKRVERELSELDWMKSFEEKSIIRNSKKTFKIFYFNNEDSTSLYDPHKEFGELTQNEYKKIDQIVDKMKKFDSKILGYDKEYLLRKQEVVDNSLKNINFNAPNNYSSKTLKDEIFPFLFKDQKLQLTLNQLFLILQKAIEQYIGTLQLSKSFEISDQIIYGNSSDKKSASLIDLQFIDQQIFETEENLIREILSDAIEHLPEKDVKVVSTMIGTIKLSENILNQKKIISVEYEKEEAKEKEIKISFQNIKFFPIKIGMREKQIQDAIFFNIVNNWYDLKIKPKELFDQSQNVLKKLMDSIEHESQEVGSYRRVALDIFHEIFQRDVSIKYTYEEDKNE